MTGLSNREKKILEDIEIIKTKYGSMKSIESAERIMRVARFAEEKLTLNNINLTDPAQKNIDN
jgi:hypothetical protein